MQSRIKTKNIRIQTVVVGGWSPGQGRRTGGVGSLLLGLPDPPGNADLTTGAGLRYIGHVGTGFTNTMLTDLARRLAAPAQPTSPFTAAGGAVPREHARGARWVTPVIVGEVAYAEWTPERVLRHPSWRGYRPDPDGPPGSPGIAGRHRTRTGAPAPDPGPSLGDQGSAGRVVVIPSAGHPQGVPHRIPGGKGKPRPLPPGIRRGRPSLPDRGDHH